MSTRPRAVIFDIYGTLLKVEPPPAAGSAFTWESLLSRHGLDAEVTLGEFDRRCAALIPHHHARAPESAHPEVPWATLVVEAWPPLAALAAGPLESFLYGHARLQRRCVAMPGAVDCLARCRASGIIIGIASNAQHYTRHEMAAAGMSLDAFDLVFLSGDHGVAKPSPRVFRYFTELLGLRGIAPPEIMMVGDREDNDLAPARAAQWQVWAHGPTHGLAALQAWLFPPTSAV